MTFAWFCVLIVGDVATFRGGQPDAVDAAVLRLSFLAGCAVVVPIVAVGCCCVRGRRRWVRSRVEPLYTGDWWDTDLDGPYAIPLTARQGGRAARLLADGS
jgi:hypothetical protein